QCVEAGFMGDMAGILGAEGIGDPFKEITGVAAIVADDVELLIAALRMINQRAHIGAAAGHENGDPGRWWNRAERGICHGALSLKSGYSNKIPIRPSHD